MKDYDAVMIVEGVQEPKSIMEYLEAAAHLVKTGLAWSLQGFFGRTCHNLIAEGLISKAGEVLVTEEKLTELEE